MEIKKLIEKYEDENRRIMNRRPDLTIQGDFTPDGIKLFCNVGFIDDLKCVGKADSTSEKDLRVCNVIASAWISVKEQMPEEDGIGYLVYGKLKLGHFYNTAIWYKGDFILTDNPDFDTKITHWMPLPNPPAK